MWEGREVGLRGEQGSSRLCSQLGKCPRGGGGPRRSEVKGGSTGLSSHQLALARTCCSGNPAELSLGEGRWRRVPLLPKDTPGGETWQKRASDQRGKALLFPHPENVFILGSNTFRLEIKMRFHFLFISLIFFNLQHFCLHK